MMLTVLFSTCQFTSSVAKRVRARGKDLVLLPIGLCIHNSVCQVSTCCLQPVAMDLDGDQLVSAGKMQQEETLSTELNLSRARETNGEAHIAPQQQINEGASELPSEVGS